jgi:hypothetical protein
MIITITPDIEAALVELARRLGTSPERLALDTLREKIQSDASEPPREEWEALLFRAGSPAGVSLPDEATTSESLYD